MLVVNFQNEKPIPYCPAYIPWMGLHGQRLETPSKGIVMDEFIEDVDWSIEPDGSLLLSDDDGPIIQVAMSREQRLSLAIVLISASMSDGTVH